MCLFTEASSVNVTSTSLWLKRLSLLTSSYKTGVTEWAFVDYRLTLSSLSVVKVSTHKHQNRLDIQIYSKSQASVPVAVGPGLLEGSIFGGGFAGVGFAKVGFTGVGITGVGIAGVGKSSSVEIEG